MKATRTKSGRWRARYIDHYEIKDGKKKPVLGCVTASTENKAIQEAIRRSGKGKATDSITVSYAIAQYIKTKGPILSPSTLRIYKSLEKNAFDDIAVLKLSEATGANLQLWIVKYSEKHSPKSVRNAHGLLASAVKMFDRSIDTSVTFPQKKPPELYTPTDDDIKRLLNEIKGTELEKAVLLAAFGTLRRGEVCGLSYDDIKGNTITVRHSLVELDGGGTALKAPKTPQSIRTITLPQKVIRALLRDYTPGGQVVKLTPSAISNAFPDALKKANIPPFRFHDLRAYSASIRHALGVPDQYIMSAGGWKTDATLKAIYRRTMADKKSDFDKKANKHFSKMLS